MPEKELLYHDEIDGPLLTFIAAFWASIFGSVLTRRTEGRVWKIIIAIYTATMVVLTAGSLLELRRIERGRAAEEQEQEADVDA